MIDGAYHDVDSSALAFEIASRGIYGPARAGSVLQQSRS